MPDGAARSVTLSAMCLVGWSAALCSLRVGDIYSLLNRCVLSLRYATRRS